MSKIVRAVNAMIMNSDRITDVHSKGSEYYFVYDKKHKWSIFYEDDDDVYYLNYYPGDTKNEFITYKSNDLNTREAYESYRDLYTLVKEKLYKVDEVLEEIISSSY